MSLTSESPHGSLRAEAEAKDDASVALLDFLAAFNVSTRFVDGDEGADGDETEDGDTDRAEFSSGEVAIHDARLDERPGRRTTGFEHTDDPTPTSDLYFQTTPETPAWQPARPAGSPMQGSDSTPYRVQATAASGPMVQPKRRAISNARLAAAAIATLALTSGGLFAYKQTRPTVHPTLASLSATRILQASVAAAIRSGSTHIFETDSRGSIAAHAIGDVSITGGTVQTAIGKNSIRMTSADGQLYMLGSSASLRSFGFPASSASRYAGLWMALPRSSRPNQVAVQELQLTTLVDGLIDLGGPLSVVEAPAKGEVAIVGAIPANAYNSGSGSGDRATLTISTSYPYLPLSLSYGDAHNGSTVDTFSSWGEKVVVAAPPHAQKLQLAQVPPTLAT